MSKVIFRSYNQIEKFIAKLEIGTKMFVNDSWCLYIDEHTLYLYPIELGKEMNPEQICYVNLDVYLSIKGELEYKVPDDMKELQNWVLKNKLIGVVE